MNCCPLQDLERATVKNDALHVTCSQPIREQYFQLRCNKTVCFHCLYPLSHIALTSEIHNIWQSMEECNIEYLWASEQNVTKHNRTQGLRVELDMLNFSLNSASYNMTSNATALQCSSFANSVEHLMQIVCGCLLLMSSMCTHLISSGAWSKARLFTFGWYRNAYQNAKMSLNWEKSIITWCIHDHTWRLHSPI